MNVTRLVAAGFAALFATCPQLPCQATRVAVKPGEQLTFRSTHSVKAGDRGARSTESSFEFQLTVRTVRDDGSIDATVRWTRVFGRGGSLLEGRSFDTAERPNTEPQGLLGEFMAALHNFIATEQAVTYDARGKLTSAPGLEESARRAGARAKTLARILIPSMLSEQALRERLRVFFTAPEGEKGATKIWSAAAHLCDDFAELGDLAHEVTEVGKDHFTVRASAPITPEPSSPAGDPSATDNPAEASTTPSTKVRRFTATWTATNQGVIRQARIEGTVQHSVPARNAETTTEQVVIRSLEQIDGAADKSK